MGGGGLDCTKDRGFSQIAANDVTDRPLDRLNRQLHADQPNPLWVSDFTDVSTRQSWQYVAFVIDVYAMRIVGGRVSQSMITTDLVLDALKQTLYARQPSHDGFDPPSRQRSAMPEHPLQRTTGLGGHRTVGRQPGRFSSQPPYYGECA